MLNPSLVGTCYLFLTIAERLGARLLIVQHSQFAFLCMYIRHTLIALAWFLWSRPQTTSHVVLVRPGGDRRSCVCESGNGAGAILYGTGPNTTMQLSYSVVAKLLAVSYALKAACKQVIHVHCVVRLILAQCNCLARMTSTAS